MSLKIDKIKDYIINTYLQIRLFVILKLNITIDDRHMLGYKLTFIDEFNKELLDRKKWITKTYQGYRYHPRAIEGENGTPITYFIDNAFYIKYGVLNLITTDEPIRIKHIDQNGMDWGYFKIFYRTGQIDSSQYFRQKYGYYEIRSKMSDQVGQFPAFWLTTMNTYPTKISIYEVNTTKGFNRLETSVHRGSTHGGKENRFTHRVKDISKGFHNYSLEWEEEYIKLFYDNILIRKITEKDILKELNYDMHIIINGRILSNENADEARYPTNYYIDYIKAYKRK